jgi:hypothetical protein
VVEPELFASLRPPTYQGDMDDKTKALADNWGRLPERNLALGGRGHGQGKGEGRARDAAEYLSRAKAGGAKANEALDFQQGVASTRLLSYAIDLGTEVAPEAAGAPDTLLKVKAYKGILYASFKVRQSKTYVIKNRSEHERTVLIEHPFRSDWQLVIPAKPAERTRDVYRFEVAAAPNKAVKQEVVEEQTRIDQVALSNSPDEAVRVFLRSTISSPKVKAALEEALSLKAKLEETRNLIRREEEALKVIEQDQSRMRANMAQVPQTSEAYKRYLKKFDNQETEIEKRRDQIAKLQESAEKLRKEFDDFLLKLDVE